MSAHLQIRRLIEVVRNGIEEIISGAHFNTIQLSEDKYIIVMIIPKSLNCPHRVKGSIESDHRFYGRNSRGKYELSFYEIRDKFMQSATVRDNIRKFQLDRIAEIKKNQSPIQLQPGPKIALHIIPLSAFSSMIECDPSRIRKIYQGQNTYNWFAPIGYERNGTKNEINLDGFLSYQSVGYVQFYREGIVEAVSTIPQLEGEQSIHSGFYEPAILKQKYLNILKELDFTPPFCIFLSHFGILLRDVILDLYDDSLYSTLFRAQPVRKRFPRVNNLLVVSKFYLNQIKGINKIIG